MVGLNVRVVYAFYYLSLIKTIAVASFNFGSQKKTVSDSHLIESLKGSSWPIAFRSSNIGGSFYNIRVKV